MLKHEKTLLENLISKYGKHKILNEISNNTLFKKRKFLIKELVHLFELNDIDYIDIESMNLPTIYLDKNNYEYKLTGISYDGDVYLELSRGKIDDEMLLKDIDFNYDIVNFYNWFINNINTIRRNVSK